MSKPKRTALQKIQTLETMKIAKLFFYIYLTPSIVTRILYPIAYKRIKEKNQQGFVMPSIRDCLEEWKKEGFIEKSEIKLPFRVEKKRGKPYFLENYGYRLNLEPLYRYCKENHKIEFTKEEKDILDKRIGLEVMRKRIFREYPNEDIINAMLKFYLKEYGIAHIEILDKKQRELLEALEKKVEKDLKLIEKQEKHKSSKKKIPFVLIERDLEERVFKKVYENFIDEKTQKLKVPEEDLKAFAKLQRLKLYITNYKKNPQLISSINAKFKKALGIA